MDENVKIIITDYQGKIVSEKNEYSAYSFDTQYGAVADAFNLTLVKTETDIEPGYGVQFLINGKTAFRGIIQKRDKQSSKNDIRYSLSGKDRAGILVEAFCNEFKDYTNTAPKTIIDALINQTTFLTKPKGTLSEAADTTGFNNSTDITDRNAALLADVNESETASRLEDKTYYDDEFTALAVKPKFKISPGDMVFQKIDELVRSVGFEILYQENGTLYIGDLNKKRYDDKVIYKIVYRKDGKGNNVETANFIEDISGRYSTVSATSQSEGYRYTSAFPHVNKEKIATDSTLDYKKYFHAHVNDDDAESPENVAIRIREDQRLAGYQLIYETPGHTSPSGELWKINRYVNVYDEINKIYEHLVLYGRTYVFSEDTGRGTILRLSKERLNVLTI